MVPPGCARSQVGLEAEVDDRRRFEQIGFRELPDQRVRGDGERWRRHRGCPRRRRGGEGVGLAAGPHEARVEDQARRQRLGDGEPRDAGGARVRGRQPVVNQGAGADVDGEAMFATPSWGIPGATVSRAGAEPKDATGPRKSGLPPPAVATSVNVTGNAIGARVERNVIPGVTVLSVWNVFLVAGSDQSRPVETIGCKPLAHQKAHNGLLPAFSTAPLDLPVIGLCLWTYPRTYCRPAQGTNDGHNSKSR